MGDRANIGVIMRDFNDEANTTVVFFYSHWGGSQIEETLADALDRGRGRWSDDSYLARIIFSEMVKDEILGDTGYGMSIYVGDNEYDILIVDLESNLVFTVDEATATNLNRGPGAIAMLLLTGGEPFDEFVVRIHTRVRTATPGF